MLISLCTLFSQTINIVRRCVNQLFRNKSSLRWTLSSSLGLIRRLKVEKTSSLLLFTIGETILTEGHTREFVKIIKLFKQTTNGLIHMVYYHYLFVVDLSILHVGLVVASAPIAAS